jgi:imidazolonepropionase-like amidohydrolase
MRRIRPENNQPNHKATDVRRLLLLGLLLLCISIWLTACAGDVAQLPPTAQPSPLPTPTEQIGVSSAATAPPTISIPTAAVPAATSAPSPTPGLVADLVLRGATLIPGNGDPPLADAVVAIKGDRIVGLGRAGDLAVDAAAQTLDLRGATILPGFVNAHVHSYTLTPDRMKDWTRAGITTVRDLAGPLDALMQRKRDFATSGDAQLPRLLAAGPMLTVPAGHPIPIYGLNDRVLAVRGPDDARAQVNALLDAGVDLIKIAVSGRTDVSWPELSDEEIRAITQTAHMRGARVTAHVDRAAALRRAVENGVDDAAHSPRDRIPDDLIALMIERGVALIPTVDVYEGLAEERGEGPAWRRVTLPVMQDNLRRFVEAGGTLALGDDYGNPRVELGMPLAEIEHWIAAGLTPMQVIVAATRGGAIVCGMQQDLGTLAPSNIADLLVVNGDPLADIHALEQVVLVVHNGVITFSA